MKRGQRLTEMFRQQLYSWQCSRVRADGRDPSLLGEGYSGRASELVLVLGEPVSNQLDFYTQSRAALPDTLRVQQNSDTDKPMHSSHTGLVALDITVLLSPKTLRNV